MRFLVGDTDAANARLDDEEIWALVNDYVGQYGDGDWVRYLAAADLMSTLRARWIVAGGGIVEKEVSKLRIRYGIQDSQIDVIANHVAWLRAEGARRRIPRPKYFGML